MAGFVGKTELDRRTGFEGALTWMEEGGVSIWLGSYILDEFQLHGSGSVWECARRPNSICLWKRVAHTNGTSYFNVLITIDKWALGAS